RYIGPRVWPSTCNPLRNATATCHGFRQAAERPPRSAPQRRSETPLLGRQQTEIVLSARRAFLGIGPLIAIPYPWSKARNRFCPFPSPGAARYLHLHGTSST